MPSIPSVQPGLAWHWPGCGPGALGHCQTRASCATESAAVGDFFFYCGTWRQESLDLSSFLTLYCNTPLSTRTHTHTHMYSCKQIHMHTHIHTYATACMCMHTHTNTNTKTHTHTHTHKAAAQHTQTHTSRTPLLQAQEVTEPDFLLTPGLPVTPGEGSGSDFIRSSLAQQQ